MQKKVIEEKLNPQDRGLCQMVQSLLKKEVEPKLGDGHYFFEADYSGNTDPEFLLALYDAICGKIGDGLVKIEDDAERKCFIVYVKYGEKNVPRSFYADADEAVGDEYSDGEKTCRALMYDGKNAEQMSKFVGGGVRQKLGGKQVFSFLNAFTVIKHIRVGEYVRKVADGLYDVTSKANFEGIWRKR